MALEVKNAPGQAGRVHLVFDRDIAGDPLRIAICNRISRIYLGHSVGKANWSPARSHFFEAVLVSRSPGETTFSVGPEVTTFIPDETTVEVSTEDNAIREVAVWKGVLLDFHWTAPASAADEARRIQEQDDRRRADEQRRRAAEAARQAEAERQRQAAEEKARRDAAEAEARRKAAEVEAERQRKAEQEANRQREAEARDKERRAAAEAEARRKAAEEEEKRQREAAEAKAAEAKVAEAKAAEAKAAEARAAEAKAAEAKAAEARAAEARAAEAKAAEARAAEEARVEAERAAAQQAEEKRRKEAAEAEQKAAEQKAAEEKALAEAAAAEAIRKAEEEAAATADETPQPPSLLDTGESSIALPPEGPPPLDAGNAPPMPEKRPSRAYTVVAIALAAVAVIWAISWGTENPVALCRQSGLFCERATFAEAEACTARKGCGADCVAEYRRQYPNGRYKAEIDRLVALKTTTCRDFEKDMFDQVASCTSSKSCGIAECVAPYRATYPSGRFKDQVDQLVATKGLTCPTGSRERSVYDRATSCAATLSCGAAHCFTEYQRDYPNGEFRAQISVLAATKGQICQWQIVSRSPQTDPGFDCNKPARDIIEEMICMDEDMARANGDLQRTFDARRQSLRGNAREALVAQEREWIQRRDRDCNVPGQRPWNNAEHRQVKSCFVEKTRARRNELQR